jgi:SPOR domain
VADPKDREAALASIEQTCPRCGAPRTPRQEYCIECGLRLPQTTGTLAALRRRWIRRFGWYPGDWVWMSLLGLVVAIAGAAGAIALSGNGGNGGTTIIAPPPPAQTTSTTTTTTTTPLPTPPEQTKTKTKPKPKTTTTRATTTTAAPNGQTVWPAATSGWTIVLGSYPLSAGPASATATARRAAHGGLTQVGVLDSSAWSSLHPGYYVVFSGIYASSAAAEAAIPRARAHGFSLPYIRPIAH